MNTPDGKTDDRLTWKAIGAVLAPDHAASWQVAMEIEFSTDSTKNFEASSC